MTTYEGILTAAHEAARVAIEAEIRRQPEDPHAFDCGFAWVHIRDGRSPFVEHCRKMAKQAAPEGCGRYYGQKHWSKGWYFWLPGSFHGQSVRIHMAGARAFANVINQYLPGVGAYADMRLD